MRIPASSGAAPTRLAQFIRAKVDVDASFEQHLGDRLWVDDLRPHRNYIEREFFYVVVQFTLGEGLEQYEAIISRKPFERQPLNFGVGDKSLTGYGLYAENMVAVASGGSLDDPEWTCVPAWLTIKLADKNVDGLAGPFYFSPETRQFRRIGLPWSPESLNYILKSSHEIATNGSQPFINLRRDILPLKHKLYDALAGLRVFLGFESDRFAFEYPGNIDIKFADYFLGPLDYGLGTANRLLQRVIDNHDPVPCFE